MTGANSCMGRRLVNATLRRRAKKNFYVALVICAIGWAQGTSFPQATQASVGPQLPAASPAPSGQHDFDFHFGTWKAHNLLLAKPLSGSTTWIELNGTVTVRKIWDGRANLEEIESSVFQAGSYSMDEAFWCDLFGPTSHPIRITWNSRSPMTEARPGSQTLSQR